MANWIPGINVGNAVKQVGSVVGLAPKGDYDILDSYTNSNRAGQTQVGFLPDVQTGSTLIGTQPAQSNAPNPPQNITNVPPVDTSVVDSVGRRWSSAAAMNNNAANVRRNTGVKQGGYEADSRTTAAGNKQTYGNDAQDFVGNIRTGQNTINSGRVNNALNLRRSMASIASGLRQGIRSGAVNLANMNAMDSGAAEAMARAFARQGNSQAGDVNNEAQLKENELGTQQNNLNIQEGQGLGRLKSWRDNKVNEISTKLWQNLSELDAAAQGEGMNGLVDMGMRDRVVRDASAALDEVDAITQRDLAAISGLDYGQVQEQAASMDTMGAEANPFTYEGGGVQFGQTPGAGLPGAPLPGLTNGAKRRDESFLTVPLQTRQDETVTV